MATMSEKQKDSLKDSQFGLPDERKYPMPDKAHARNAKARAVAAGEQGQPVEGRRGQDRPQGGQGPRPLTHVRATGPRLSIRGPAGVSSWS